MTTCHACGEVLSDSACAQKPNAEFREYLDKACTGDASRYTRLMKRLQVWRNEDHEDNLVLCRSDVIEIIEGWKA